MIIQFILLFFGLALLWGGAELLIRYSSALARSMGVSPIIIGLTIVSIGTSLPEFVVSLIAAMQNTMGISIGNIIGSNIANMGLILGIGALIVNLEVKKEWVYKEIPFMLFATFLFTLFARTNYTLGRIEGSILFLFLILFLGYLYRASMLQIRKSEDNKQKESQLNPNTKLLYFLLAILGIAFLIYGSKTTVNAGIKIASTLGVNETVIGLTLIAVGTSLPELATTIVGILKNENDIVVGNVIGSNIFNLLFIGSAVPLIQPIQISTHLFEKEFYILIGLSVLIWPIVRIRWNVQRIEGLILLVIYILFIISTFQIT